MGARKSDQIPTVFGIMFVWVSAKTAVKCIILNCVKIQSLVSNMCVMNDKANTRADKRRNMVGTHSSSNQ